MKIDLNALNLVCSGEYAEEGTDYGHIILKEARDEAYLALRRIDRMIEAACRNNTLPCERPRCPNQRQVFEDDYCSWCQENH